MQNGEYVVTLDDLPKAANLQMFFKSNVLTATEKKTIKIKLKNNNMDEPVSQIFILSKPHKMKGYYYAIVFLKDGTRTNVVMRNVL
jgi:transketolase N-terminal domain/subunit